MFAIAVSETQCLNGGAPYRALAGNDAWQQVTQITSTSDQPTGLQSELCQQSIEHAQTASQAQSLADINGNASTTGHQSSEGNLRTVARLCDCVISFGLYILYLQSHV